MKNMKNIKKFENFKINENAQDDDSSPVKVKDLINFLKQLNPDANVILNKNDWGDEEGDPLNIIKHNGIFEIFGNDLFINN